MIYLPAISNNNHKVFCINDLWEVLSPCIYIAAESLLDMLHLNVPVSEQSNGSELKGGLNNWYTSAGVYRGGANLKFNDALDDCSSIDLRFVKDFVFRTLQCLASFDKSEKLLSVAMKFNVLTK